MRIPDNIGLVQDPNHLGAVILDKLIGDLKSKLPFLSKKKGKDEDEDEDFEEDGDSTETETEVAAEDDDVTNLEDAIDDDDETSIEEVQSDNSLIGKLKSKITSLRNKKSADADVEDDGDEEAAGTKKAKKKPNFIVIGVALALIGFIIYSDFGDETPPAEKDPSTMLKPRKKAKQPVAETPAEEKPVETVAKPEEPTPVETPTETVTAEPTTDITPIETTVETETPVITPDVTEPIVEEPTTPDFATETPMGPDNSMVDSVTGEDTAPSDDNLTDQILRDLENQAAVPKKEDKPAKTEYVSPPNYENVGRGLVYNCAGKHWACVDGPSYKTCEENSSSTKFLNKNIECYPFNVYATQSGCEKMQNRMVSSSAKTSFCSEN